MPNRVAGCGISYGRIAYGCRPDYDQNMNESDGAIAAESAHNIEEAERQQMYDLGVEFAASGETLASDSHWHIRHVPEDVLRNHGSEYDRVTVVAIDGHETYGGKYSPATVAITGVRTTSSTIEVDGGQYAVFGTEENTILLTDEAQNPDQIPGIKAGITIETDSRSKFDLSQIGLDKKVGLGEPPALTAADASKLTFMIRDVVETDRAAAAQQQPGAESGDTAPPAGDTPEA
jgi:hypothetical protein